MQELKPKPGFFDSLRGFVSSRWGKKTTSSYMDTTLAMDGFADAEKDLKRAYEEINAMPGSNKLGELEKRTYALSSVLDNAKERMNSLNRGPTLGPMRKLKTVLNQLRAKIEDQALEARIKKCQFLVTEAELRLKDKSRLNTTTEQEQQRLLELQRLRQELAKLEQELAQQQQMLSAVEGQLNVLTKAFTAAVTTLYTTSYAAVGLEYKPANTYEALMQRVIDLSPDAMQKLLEANNLTTPGGGNRLILTALEKGLTNDAALNQAEITTKAKGIINELKPAAAKIDAEETKMQKEYDAKAATLNKEAERLRNNVNDLEKRLDATEQQAKPAASPSPQQTPAVTPAPTEQTSTSHTPTPPGAM